MESQNLCFRSGIIFLARFLGSGGVQGFREREDVSKGSLVGKLILALLRGLVFSVLCAGNNCTFLVWVLKSGIVSTVFFGNLENVRFLVSCLVFLAFLLGCDFFGVVAKSSDMAFIVKSCDMAFIVKSCDIAAFKAE